MANFWPKERTVLTSLVLSLFLAFHPIHVSVTNMDVDPQKKIILISQKMYTDDFSLLFYHLYEKNIKPQAEREFTQAEKDLVCGYMSVAFVIESGKQKLPLQYLRKEQKEESIWLYYSCSLPSGKMHNLMLTDAVLLDLFEDQTNLVIVNYMGNDKGYTFNYKGWKSEINLTHP